LELIYISDNRVIRALWPGETFLRKWGLKCAGLWPLLGMNANKFKKEAEKIIDIAQTMFSCYGGITFIIFAVI
jgi:hypothetical protein